MKKTVLPGDTVSGLSISSSYRAPGDVVSGSA